MSEPIWMSIEIGGDLFKETLEELINLIGNVMNDITGEFEIKDIIKISGLKTAVWSGFSNYGECDEIKDLCREYKLSYIHYSDAIAGEGDAVRCWWIPKMGRETRIITSYDGSPVVEIDKIKPLIKLLLAYHKDGESILPLFIKEEGVKNIVEIGFKDPEKILLALEKKFKKLMPDIPKIPPIRIIQDVRKDHEFKERP